MVALGSVPSFGSISAAFKLVRVHLCALQWGGPEKRRPRLPKAREKPDDERRKKQSQALPCSSPLLSAQKSQSRVPIPPQLAPPNGRGRDNDDDEKERIRCCCCCCCCDCQDREREEEISWNSALGDGNSGAGIPKKLNRTIIATI